MKFLKSFNQSLLLALMLAPAVQSWAQGVAFTYQGQLDNSGSAANGTYDFAFDIFNVSSGSAPVAGPMTNLGVGVTNGMFITVISNVPANIFNGSNLWLEIGVRTNGAGTFATLSPRQNLTAVPYAVSAASLSTPLSLGQLPATLVTNNAANVTLNGAFTGNGAGLTNLNATRIVPGLGTMAFQNTNGPLMTMATNYGPLKIAPNAAFPYTSAQEGLILPPFGILDFGDGNAIYDNPLHGPSDEVQFTFSSRAALLMGYNDQHNAALQVGASNFGGDVQGAAASVDFEGDKYPQFASDPLGYSLLVYFRTPYFNGLSLADANPVGMRGEAVDTNGGVSLVFYQAANLNPLVGQSPGTKIGTEFWSNGNVVHGRVTSDLVQVTPVGTYGVSWDAPARTEVDVNGDIIITNVPLTYARTNQQDTRTLYFFPGVGSPAVTFPTNWSWGSETDGNPGAPTHIPAATILKVEVELLTDSATNYLARAAYYPYPAAVDPDAQKFFNAVGGGLSPTESNAVNRLASSLKANNLWQYWDCIYPLVGGTSNSCSWNLANPNQYRIAWTVGTSTFAAAGWLADGAASFGDTQFNPTTATAPNYTLDSITLLVYCGTSAPNYTFWNYFTGAVDSANHRSGLMMVSPSLLASDGVNDANGPGSASVVGMSSFAGPLAVTRLPSPPSDGIYGGGQYVTGNTAPISVPNLSFYIGARNSGVAGNFIGARFGLVMIGGGLSNSQMTALTNIVAKFETTLGRQ